MAYYVHRGDGFGFGDREPLDCTRAGCASPMWEGGPYCRRHAQENLGDS